MGNDSLVGIYLAGSGSLDGSDIFTAVAAFDLVQQRGWIPKPVSRDIEQGQTLNHRTAAPHEAPRNALDEAARIVRGDIVDMSEVDPHEFIGALFVGGGGVLSSWLDFHERGKDCRVTERLKIHVNRLYEDNRPILGLDSAVVAIARILGEKGPLMNPGNNSSYEDALDDFGAELTSARPCWDNEHRIGSLPDLTAIKSVASIRESVDGLIGMAEPDFERAEQQLYRERLESD